MQDYSLLRWPCPEGFHVPISTEWQDIIQMIGSLWLTNNSSVVYTTYLKLQYHWYYDSYMRTKIINNWETVYRCCDKYNLDTNNSAAVTFNIHTPNWWTWIASMYHSRKDNWCSIRPFKDTQVIPDSSRTVLYDWSSVATWAWIFRDQINWLISISSDWFNWKTISDSDLSAATWSYFQRWNDYAFSWEEDMPWGNYSSRPNTQWFWPKNHYISANFITLWSADVSWDNPTNNDLWWYESFIADNNDIFLWEWPWVSDNKWPCLNWFHIPTRDEHISLYNMYTTMLWTWWPNFMTYLHIPNMWYRAPNSWDISGAWTRWYYWTCQISSYSWTNDNNAYYIAFATNNTIPPSNWESWRTTTYWFPIRPFKNTSVIPDSSWTTLYDWSATATGAWIFRDQINWLISVSSDWINRITISDKNLWATQVWNYWDTMTESNCWWFFQRWNNYMFSFSWNITTSSTRVNAKNYWPKNYYSSSTFITNNNFSWDTYKNRNLWWWDTRGAGYDHLELYVWDWIPKSSFRWPCSYWFHVPTWNEWRIVTNIMNHLFPKNEYYTSIHPDYYKQYLHMPIPWDLWGDWQRSWDDRSIEYWASTPSDSHWYAETIYLNNLNWENSNVYVSGYYRWRWFPIRPFKDDAIALDYSFNTYIRDLVKEEWSFRLYENTRDWFLSLTDWERWITMTDKNLWATTVYNPWDTLTQDNCWWFFQRWNNYMFPFSWATTTSASQVDATWYWPLNPYSSNTFVELYNNRVDWSNPQNDNLRWWTTQSIQNVAEVYKWTTLVRSNYQPTTPTAWIYWNPTKWMISLSSDWNERLTIADKNVWARYVYNQWDEETQDNIWFLFQQWNNYPLIYTWTIPTSSTRIDTSWYYKYSYVNDQFITWTDIWTTWCNYINLRWWDSPKLESIKWPCNDWYHIPTKSEWLFLLKKLDIRWILWSNPFKQYLKMPYAWRINWFSLEKNSGATGYRSSTHEHYNFSNQSAWILAPTATAGYVKDRSIADWYPIRPFKNDPVTPNRNDWTALYDTSSSWTISWIWHNATLWLISIWDSYEKWWITISDKNLWATVIYNDWDTMSETNCWWYFQYWNNYMFPFDWPTTTSTTLVDTTWYWPGNYYSSSTFVKASWSHNFNWWMTSYNSNIWWCDDIIYEKTIWPCNPWWHIPTFSDWNKIKNITHDLVINNNNINIRECLKIPPYITRILQDWTISNYSNYTSCYWMSAIANNDGWFSNVNDELVNQFYLNISNTSIYFTWTEYNIWHPIRPFKNEPVVPNDTSRIKLA